MSKISTMLDVGRRSMMNSQTALQTVGHNIANKSTEGYTRQRVELKANEPTGLGQVRIGNGARTGAVTRTNNPYLEKQLGKERAGLGFLNGKADALMRVEQVYNEQINKGLNHFVGDLFNAFREQANNPESVATRTLVRDTADFVTRDFHRIDNQLSEIRKDIDQQIAVQVNDINALSEEIANLNQKIQSVEIGGQGEMANDERDRRDLLIKQLGEKINIRWAEGKDNSVTITAGNSAILVSGYDARKLVAQPTAENGRKAEGNFDIFYLSNDKAVPARVTEQFTGGSIGGLLEVRDQVISDVVNEMDDMAHTLTTEVNKIHVTGYDAFGRTGIMFFAPTAEAKGASANIRLSEALMEDPNNIASAAAPNAPGDNRVANAISQLQYEKIAKGGTGTLDDSYNGLVGQIGIITRRANSSQEAQTEIVKQLNNIRESISGVSLDEEATKMIEYQKSFDASARLIRTADEMFDTVLNLRRY